MNRPPLLRKGNSELSAIGVYTWSIPALRVRLGNRTLVKTCPNAGICAALCYAKTGRYVHRHVMSAHIRNLEFYLLDRNGWINAISRELESRRFLPTGVPHKFEWEVRQEFSKWMESGGRAVRIHDTGDFFRESYMLDWLGLAASHNHILFYAYTKQVSSAKKAIAEGLVSDNFVFIFSMGGREDRLIDINCDRHDDIFPDVASLEQSGYVDQRDSDLMAALHPCHKIGIVSNNIPRLKRMQGSLAFSALQENGFRDNM